MVNFKDIEHARRILGLNEMATMQEIKESYRKLALKYHPDRCKGKDKEKCEKIFKKINNAYEIIMAYCAGYRFSFKKEDAKKANLDYAYAEYVKGFDEEWMK